MLVQAALFLHQMKTHERIMQTATKAFNEKGYGAVNLLEISQLMGISRGNLTYHFKTKEVLLEAIVKQMWSKIENEKSVARQFPSFENMHNEIHLYYKVQMEYSFVFLDPHVSGHEQVQKGLRTMIQQSIKDYQDSIVFAVEHGNMRPESAPGCYNALAFAVWMVVYNWLAQQNLRGQGQGQDAEKQVWSLIYPHMTEKGVEEFERFFGANYLDGTQGN